MSVSKLIKEYGLDSVKQVAEMVEKTPDTIHNWHKKEPALFRIVIMGCVAKKTHDSIIEANKKLKGKE